MTTLWKTNKNTEFYFLPTHENYTDAFVQRYQAFDYRWSGLLLQMAFSVAVKLSKPRGCISWSVWPLKGINKNTWDTKLFLMASLAYPVSCACVGHLRTDGTDLLFVSERMRYSSFGSCGHTVPLELLIFQINISRNTKCENLAGFPKSARSHLFHAFMYISISPINALYG